MKLNFKKPALLEAKVGDILYLDDVTYALVVEASSKGFSFLNITQPNILPRVSGYITYKQLKTIKYIGSLMTSRLELLTLNCNTNARPKIAIDSEIDNDLLGAMVLNISNELLCIIEVTPEGYQVYNTSNNTTYLHNIKSLGALYVLAKYSAYTLHFDE